MEFSYEVKDSYAEVKADGRLNMVSAPKLREFVTDVIAGGPTASPLRTSKRAWCQGQRSS